MIEVHQTDIPVIGVVVRHRNPARERELRAATHRLAHSG
jgi:hypothetical protein